MDGINTFDLKTSIVEAATNLFDTMLSMEINLTEEEIQTGSNAPKMTGSLSFAGELMGSINIHTSFEFAGIMTAAMMGMEVDEIESDEEINDVILEACNIIGGNLKSDFNDAGMQCVISTPSITTGSNFDIESLSMERHEKYTFVTNDQKILIEVCLKSADTVKPDEEKRLTSIDISKLSRLDVISSAGDSVIEFFDTMLSINVELADHGLQPVSDGTYHIMGLINFAGDVRGSLSIKVSDDFARDMTSAMLGIGLDEIESSDEVKDVIGEAANIISGNLKAAFCDTGLNCVISPPSITAGNDFKLKVLNMDRYEHFTFHFERHEIIVEVCVKIDAASPPDAARENEKEIETGESTVTDDHMEKETPVVPNFQEEQGETEKTGDIENNRSHQKNNSKEPSVPGINETNFAVIMDIPLEIKVELGRTKIKICDLIGLGPESAVMFSNHEGESFDILANDKLIAQGEVLVENNKYGIRITRLLSRMDRIMSIR